MKNQFTPDLRNIPPFAGLSNNAREYLQSRLRRYHFSPGASIISQGKRGSFFAIIEQGAVILQESNGETQTLMPGAMFGEGMMRYGVPSSFSVRALSEISLWVIKRSDWLTANQLQIPGPTQKANKPITKKAHRGINRWISALAIFSLFLCTAWLILGSSLIEYTNHRVTQIAIDAGRLDLAREYLDFALQIQPDSAQIFDALGYLLYQENRQVESHATIKKALDIDESLASAHNNMGVILLDEGSIAESILHLENAVTLDPTSSDAYRNLGNAFLKAQDFESALQAYQKSYELNPDQIEARVLWASVALEIGQPSAAKEVWIDVIIEDPTNPIANRGLGVIAALEQDYQNALPYLQISTMLLPEDAISHYYLAITWQELEDFEKAIAEFEAVLALSQNVELIQRAQQHLARIQD